MFNKHTKGQNYLYDNSKKDTNLPHMLVEIKEWEKQDPLVRFPEWLLSAGIASQKDIEKINQEVNLIVKESVDFAESSSEPKNSEGKIVNMLSGQFSFGRHTNSVLEEKIGCLYQKSDFIFINSKKIKKTFGTKSE